LAGRNSNATAAVSSAFAKFITKQAEVARKNSRIETAALMTDILSEATGAEVEGS
jgi:hypothetical protein